MSLLSGHAAIVTGAAQGIGRAVAEALAGQGANLVLADIQDELTQTVAGIIAQQYSVQVHFVHTDITVDADAQKMARTCLDQFGRIDILVNVAGGALAFGFQRKLVELTSEQDFRRLLEINLVGPFLVTHAVLPYMKQRGYGRILLISSGAGRGYSRTGIHGYGAAKAGLLGFMRQVAREVGPHGVTVNSIAPGLIRSTRVLAAWEKDTEAGRQAFLESVAIKRMGTAEEIANAVLYFVSPHAAYTTGQTLSVDGGHYML